jgi:hypothetical protein
MFFFALKGLEIDLASSLYKISPLVRVFFFFGTDCIDVLWNFSADCPVVMLKLKIIEK